MRLDARERGGRSSGWALVAVSYVCCRPLPAIPPPHPPVATNEVTDEPVSFLDVYNEVAEKMDALHITKWASKAVQRKYAFEMPGVPAEAQYLKILYPFAGVCPCAARSRLGHFLTVPARVCARLLWRPSPGPAYGPARPNVFSRVRHQHQCLGALFAQARPDGPVLDRGRQLHPERAQGVHPATVARAPHAQRRLTS